MENLQMTSTPKSESTRLIKVNDEGAEAKPERSVYVSMALFIVLQILIFIPDGFLSSLGIQFARYQFARERNFTLPEGSNACMAVKHSDVFTEIQSEVALYSTYMSFLLYLLPVITGVPLIAVSDFIGRRPIFLLRCFAALATALIFLVVAWFDWSVYYTLIGCTFIGLSGGFAAVHAISLLYVTDIVSIKQRSIGLATVYASQYSMYYTSPLIINSILQVVGQCFTIVYLVQTCVTLIACLWILPSNIVRESVPYRQTPQAYNLCTDIIHSIKKMLAEATDGRRWRIFVILGSYSLVSFNMFAYSNTVNLYGLGEPFCWTPLLVGIFSVMFGTPNAIVAPFVVWLVGLMAADYWSIYLSIASGVAEYLLTAVATSNDVLIYSASMAGILFGISQPVFIAYLTKLVSARNQGALFALYTLVYATVTSLSMIVQSYAYSLAVGDGLAVDLFYVMAFLSALVFIPTLLMHILEPPGGFQSDPVENDSTLD